jgi:hypothetical protein
MLKITTAVLSKQEITLQLDGRVTGQWVELFALMKDLIRRGARHINPPLFVAEQIKKCKDAPV